MLKLKFWSNDSKGQYNYELFVLPPQVLAKTLEKKLETLEIGEIIEVMYNHGNNVIPIVKVMRKFGRRYDVSVYKTELRLYIFHKDSDLSKSRFVDVRRKQIADSNNSSNSNRSFTSFFGEREQFNFNE